jgi:hypothetical protein
MAALRLEWTPSAKAEFEALRQRARDTGEAERFKQIHNEIVLALRDLDQALERGEREYSTRRPGGEVRHWVHHFLSVYYVVFREEQVGWIMKYQCVPESWPEDEP